MGHHVDTPRQVDPLAKKQYLLVRGQRFYFRIKVPSDLQSWKGCKEIKKSLNTSVREEAINLIAAECLRAQLMFTADRKEMVLAGGKKSSNSAVARNNNLRSLSHLTEDQAMLLVKSWLAGKETISKGWWEEEGSQIPDTFESDKIQEILATYFHEIAAITGEAPEVVAPNDRNDGSTELKLFLREEGFTLDATLPIYDYLRRQFRAANLEHLRRATDRVERRMFRCYDPSFGDVFAGSPSKHLNIEAASSGITIAGLVRQFLSDPVNLKKAFATKKAFTAHAWFLAEVMGEDTLVESVTRANAEQVCSVIEKTPANLRKRYRGLSIKEAIRAADAAEDLKRLSPNTRRNYFANIASIFRYGTETGLVSKNHFDDRLFKQRFEVAVIEDEDQTTFTSTELQSLFTAPLYIGCENDERGYKNPGPHIVKRARFWVPLIALFHGCRQTEACQLYTEDIREVEGEMCFLIRESLDSGMSEDKHLKNKQTRRKVPVHPELMKMGFETYLLGRRADLTSPRLFPELKMSKSGSYGANFSKWWANFSTHAIGYKAKATFHGFRHGFRDALREADVSEERVNMLGGWSQPGQQAKYGRAKIIKELKVEIMKVQYPNLNLSHLYITNEGRTDLTVVNPVSFA